MRRDTDVDGVELPRLAPAPTFAGDRRFSMRIRPYGSARGDGETRFERRRRRERRATPRLACEFEVEELVGGWRYFRTTYDVSTFGLSTSQGLPHAVGTRLKVRLRLPNETEPLELEAEVVGVRNAVEGGVRLAFRDASIETMRKLHRFVMSPTPYCPR